MENKKQRNTLIVVICILLLLLIGSGTYISNLKTDNIIKDYNLMALNDTLRKVITDNGDLEVSKSILISEKGNLSKLSSELQEEVDNTKGTVKEVMVTNVEIVRDTIYVPTNIIINSDDTLSLKWVYDTVFNKTSSRKLAGHTNIRIGDTVITILGTFITEDKIRFKIVTGLRENQGKIEIFAKSDYPGLDVLNLNGAFIDPETHPVFEKYKKKKRLGVGPYCGLGFGANLRPSIQLGVGITYNLFSR